MIKKFAGILLYVLPYWLKALFSVIFNLIAAIFSVVSFTMVIPFLGILFSTQEFYHEPVAFRFNVESFQHNFNYYLGQLTEEKGELGALVFIIIVVFVATLLKNLFLYLGRSQTITIRIQVVKDIRNNLLNKVFDFDLSYFSNEKRGNIVSKMIVDVREIESSIISSFEMIFKDPILIGVYLYVLFVMSAQLTLIVIVIFPISAFIIGRIGKSLKHTTLKGQRKMGSLMGMLDEILSGIKVIKAFSAEKLAEKRFRENNDTLSLLLSKTWHKRILSGPISDIIGTISILIIMFFGGKMVLSPDSEMSSKVFIGYLAVFTQIVGPVKSFTGGYYNILKGMASVERINTILNQKFKIFEVHDAKKIDDFNDEIEYRNVSFHYETENKHVLRKINLSIKKGETVALVGQSGSGKSTIVDLLPRFFDPIKGEVLIDGINVKKYTIDSLRNLFGYVNQQPVLFNDTIYNNILFGNQHASKEQVENAAKLAFAHDFILEKEKGYETNIGQSGDNLSLGEKQRITIARAILKDPSILVLDEATSALDYESELIVQKALYNLMKDRTSIVIAHRLFTIKNADQIIVLDNGEIIEQGTHDDLLKANGKYKKLTELEYF